MRCQILARPQSHKVLSIQEGALIKWQHSTRVVSILCALLFFTAQGAYADGSVSSLRMGYGARNPQEFAQFQSVIQQYNASGERFRIDSHCQSACTMFLSIRNVCVTPDSTLLFHAGGNMQKGIINPAYSAKMASHYKPALRQYVMANHYMDTFEFHSIPGSEIISRFGYRACN